MKQALLLLALVAVCACDDVAPIVPEQASSNEQAASKVVVVPVEKEYLEYGIGGKKEEYGDVVGYIDIEKLGRREGFKGREGYEGLDGRRWGYYRGRPGYEGFDGRREGYRWREGYEGLEGRREGYRGREGYEGLEGKKEGYKGREGYEGLKGYEGIEGKREGYEGRKGYEGLEGRKEGEKGREGYEGLEGRKEGIEELKGYEILGGRREGLRGRDGYEGLIGYEGLGGRWNDYGYYDEKIIADYGKDGILRGREEKGYLAPRYLFYGLIGRHGLGLQKRNLFVGGIKFPVTPEIIEPIGYRSFRKDFPYDKLDSLYSP